MPEEDDGYREELLTLKKYFGDLQSKEIQFQQELCSTCAIENIFCQAKDGLASGNFLRAYERFSSLSQTYSICCPKNELLL